MKPTPFGSCQYKRSPPAWWLGATLPVAYATVLVACMPLFARSLEVFLLSASLCRSLFSSFFLACHAVLHCGCTSFGGRLIHPACLSLLPSRFHPLFLPSAIHKVTGCHRLAAFNVMVNPVSAPFDRTVTRSLCACIVAFGRRQVTACLVQ